MSWKALIARAFGTSLIVWKTHWLKIRFTSSNGEMQEFLPSAGED